MPGAIIHCAYPPAEAAKGTYETLRTPWDSQPPVVVRSSRPETGSHNASDNAADRGFTQGTPTQPALRVRSPLLRDIPGNQRCFFLTIDDFLSYEYEN